MRTTPVPAPPPPAARSISGDDHMPGPPSAVHLFVGNLGQGVSEEDLTFWFSQFGNVTHAKVSSRCCCWGCWLGALCGWTCRAQLG
jgi:hypothetical protein